MKGREILDSRGNPSIEVEVFTDCGFGRAMVPSGASTGAYEALELRDKESRYGGKGVTKAVNNVNNIISDCIVGIDVRAQRDVDRLLTELDGTPNKSNLGANAILGVSIAVARAAANSIDVPLFQYLGGSNVYTLPVPVMNVINGGRHAGNELSIQEFHILPIGAETFSEALRIGVETYHELENVLRASYGPGATNVGDEGGFAPFLTTTSEAFDAIMKAVDIAGYDKEIRLGMDCAASEFFKAGKYTLDGKTFSNIELMDYYEQLVNSYPIVLIEDPFEQDSYDDFARLTSRFSPEVIVGDDIFVTNTDRLAKGIEMCAANSLLLKLNQIGTISEAFDAATLAFRNGYSVVVSHRSGETEDSTIADVSVALGSEFIKTGAPARSDRNAKYNQLLRIEEHLGDSAYYKGITMRG
ncbi:MAG TPA: phosphopyruvate hydratase [Candidatus Acidoferrum sp.]|nr:phosphopyruvate hydratase [Candidatus Acidoferrum sp.]